MEMKVEKEVTVREEEGPMKRRENIKGKTAYLLVLGFRQQAISVHWMLIPFLMILR